MESLVSGLQVGLASATTTITNGLTTTCGAGAGSVCNVTSVGAILHGVADTLIYLVGAISVIMIIIGGLRYVTSNGDSKQAESARNTILYAAIGLIVAFASYAIVTFVLFINK